MKNVPEGYVHGSVSGEVAYWRRRAETAEARLARNLEDAKAKEVAVSRLVVIKSPYSGDEARNKVEGKVMTIHNAYCGEATHHLKGGRVRTFTPEGPLHVVFSARTRAKNPIEKIGQGGYSARIFVGLKVGTKTKYNIDDVINVVYRVREGQGEPPDATILAQKGIYKDRKGRRIVEPSVQVIIIDFGGGSSEAFLLQMQALAEKLREDLEQETVILELQNRGVIEAVYTVT